MIGLRFPDLDVPEGWTAETRGPRRWLIPPEGEEAGRIVLTPILPRRKNLEPQRVLEASLTGELERYAEVKQTPFAPFAASDGLGGVSTEVAILAEGGVPLERRAYAAVADERAIYMLFLQARPEAYPALLPAFLAAAASVRTTR